MNLHDLIGHTIVDVSDDVDFIIKTDKGIFELNFITFYDGSLDEVTVTKSTQKIWEAWSGRK